MYVRVSPLTPGRGTSMLKYSSFAVYGYQERPSNSDERDASQLLTSFPVTIATEQILGTRRHAF